ncbi:MAG: phenylalanine--tRNA ligase subunit alpha [Spirochaetaceae bacterium]|nr:phenylalanine--tRNA ligase subunit alpha [Spirochaetaceae bacterium]
MDTGIDLKTLHPLEVRVLLKFDDKIDISPDVVTSEVGLNVGQCNQALSWLLAKGLISETARETRTEFELTDLGKQYAELGTPEERIFAHLRAEGPTSIPDLVTRLELENKEIGSAFGALSKAGAAGMDGEKRVALKDASAATDVLVARAILDRAVVSGTLTEGQVSDDERAVLDGMSKKRGAASSPFKLVEREAVTHRMTAAGVAVRARLEAAGISGDEIGRLTPELLRTGGWKHKQFRAYNINVPLSHVMVGRRNPYSAYLDQVKDKLISLGFEQFDGSVVETEFWNSDALFMPQFHSARDIHDVYYLDTPTHAREIEEPYLSQVAASHEDGWKTGSRGWRYDFDKDFTRRLILRSQGTAVSARTLPIAKVPGRYFGMLRCFRPDDVDATHLSDFYQTEGIVLGEDVNLKTLLGLLEMFAVEVAGATDVRYVPGYFPFTEPSVEVHIKHPVLGWFELGGSGIFRPEVTEPLGVTVPVLAWGLGIDRMALMKLGLDDLRELFSPDIQSVRRRRNG